MSIKIKDALSLEYLEEFKLIAGKDGLNNTVTTVGILDHEIIEDLMHIFVEGEFLLSTLSVARDDVNLVFDAIKSLIERKAAGLAFKTVYYDTLPDYILDYANENNFPVFTFDPSIFIENIINTLFSSIKSRGIHDLLEAKLETLFQGVVTDYTVEKIALELNDDFQHFHQVIYCQEKRYVSQDNSIRIVEKFSRMKNISPHHSIFKFRSGTVMILTASKLNERSMKLESQYIMDLLSITESDYTIGRSSLKKNLMNMDQSLKESYYAFEAAVIKQVSSANYEDIGLYQFLIPLLKDPWAKRFSDRLIEPIIDYDLKYNAHLMETISLYFDNGCNTQKVSELVFQHKNTVLYRIRKVKELLGPFSSDQDFNEQMSMALKIHKINQLNI
ncbi:PucR C-terminal helix-turn-helix domain-containing protein [Dethiosulfatibacter aminovorans DSM 17477]|uniref:PucR C-terminal helix-turn-helix domain-containing protein n=1 Tax=Dethiosulfatibacter aminovorans DSM 17477 TaxID=1121476 RepID=A0A1M6HPK5_9FIRM|nr:PucR family transcriptional regulator [Dethiosulfatibacter aminovorans]SHJ24119.1 PucR C-terminal helix-turn-helix domain-containing protein [Dethiosulfatibacter aminovorans DSM 17477]